MSEEVTVVSDTHRECIRLLQNWGLELQEEVEFPPYRCDIYVPDLHLVVEVDGPRHSKGMERVRDDILRDVYYLRVFHVKSGKVKSPTEWEDAFGDEIVQAISDATERWEKAKDRCPWL